jgi:uroporphyrinogen decarboxylase
MKSRERFRRACLCEPLDRPPIWVMRQAGRHLPEYRELKTKYTFHELVQTPELAHEVTMQPIRRYGMDAAIMFSDILVIPEAMGQPYEFRDGGGIEMAYRIETKNDIDRLDASAIEERLDYVAQTLRLLRKTLGDETALIGFGGSPWTLATYMVEGGSSKDYSRAKRLFYTEREQFDALMEKITEALIAYFKMQIREGVDAIQIFDSWGGVLAPNSFWEASAKWMARISEAVRDEVPVIVFSKGSHQNVSDLVRTRPNMLGADWTTSLVDFRNKLPDNIGVQGNLDPVILQTTPAIVRRETTEILESMRGKTGHVFNLGHGISPAAKIENMEALVSTVQEFR